MKIHVRSLFLEKYHRSSADRLCQAHLSSHLTLDIMMTNVTVFCSLARWSSTATGPVSFPSREKAGRVFHTAASGHFSRSLSSEVQTFSVPPSDQLLGEKRWSRPSFCLGKFGLPVVRVFEPLPTLPSAPRIHPLVYPCPCEIQHLGSTQVVPVWTGLEGGKTEPPTRVKQ